MINYNKPLDFEGIDDTHSRAQVFGGWIVKSQTPAHLATGGGTADERVEGGWDWREAMVFVPDAKHEWVLEKEAL